MKKIKISKKKLLILFSVMAIFMCVAVIPLLSGCNQKEDPPPIIKNDEIKVTISAVTNGTITADKASYVSGDDVIFTVTPDNGYYCSEIKINDADKTSELENGRLTLKNVTADVTLTAVFTQKQTASVTLKPVTEGGSAVLNKTEGLYLGDSVTLTVTPSQNYKIFSVLVGGIDKTAELDADNKLVITLNAASTEIEVEFAEIKVQVYVSGSNDFGTISIKNPKDFYHLGDTLTVELKVNDENEHELVEFLVNGVDALDGVENGEYTLTVEKEGAINLAAVFAVKPVAIDVPISGVKFGETATLNGAEVILKSDDNTYTLTVKDGKLTGKVAPASYRVIVSGYVTKTITVARNSVPQDISLTYQLFNNTEGEDRWDTSNLGDGYVVNKNGWDLKFKDTYGDFVFKTNFYKGKDGNDSKMGFWLEVGGTAYTLEVNQWDTGVYVKCYTGMNEGNPDVWGDTYLAAKWSDKGEWMYDQYIKAYSDSANYDGLDAVIVRKGGTVSLFFETENEEYVYFGSFDVGEGQASLKLIHKYFETMPTHTKVDMSIKQSDVGEYIKGVTLTTGTLTGCTAKIKETDPRLGEIITIVLTPTQTADDNHKVILTNLTVDGVNVTEKVTNNEYSFRAEKTEYTVSATFTSTEIADLEVIVKGLKPEGEVAITSVTVKGNGYNETITLVDNKLSISGLPVGDYTLEVDGYLSQTINHAVGLTHEPVKLVYQLFNNTEGEARWDTSNLGEGYVVNKNGWDLPFKDTYGDFVFHTNFYKGKEGQDSKMGFWLKVGDTEYTIEVDQWDTGVYVKGYTGTNENPADIWNDIYLATKWSDKSAWMYDQYIKAYSDSANYDGLDAVIVRKGGTVSLFFETENEEYVYFGSFDVGEGQASLKLIHKYFETTPTHTKVVMSTKANDIDEFVSKIPQE